MASVMSNEESQKKWPQIVHEVVDTADRVTRITERIIAKSNSVFQAQLMTAKTDHMLKSLLEVLQSLDEVQEKVADGMKRLTARGTTLTATITQLISTVRSV
ncbi:unnamed protein product [Gongylonema pulchrum]|uniref:Vinculin n=1 Tax=Gongylonema pulchrum TaxID=637853 RepID=A0A183DUR8_9BILA|nr:unnamed protein product [Gongylonema pulchrum]